MCPLEFVPHGLSKVWTELVLGHSTHRAIEGQTSTHTRTYLALFPGHIVPCYDSTWSKGSVDYQALSWSYHVISFNFWTNDYNFVTFLWLESTTRRMYVALSLVQRGLSLGAGHMAEASKVNTPIHFHSPEKTSSLPTSSTHPLKQQSKGSQQKRWQATRKWLLLQSMRVSSGWSHV